MTEQALLADCLARLNRLPLDYYLTGSMASNYWGIPRTTHDLDFVIRVPPSTVPALVNEFSGDYYIDRAAVMAAFSPPYQFNAIDTRSALKVDFWLPTPAPFDQEMFKRRVSKTISGVHAWIATPEDVILHKLLWNKITPSDRQLRDAAGIWAVQVATLDRAYLERWGAELKVEDTLNQIMDGQIRPKAT
jgi:hypothetical protein